MKLNYFEKIKVIPVWPINVNLQTPNYISHNFNVLSHDALTIKSSSIFIIFAIESVCPVRIFTTSKLGYPQIIIDLSLDEVII